MSDGPRGRGGRRWDSYTVAGGLLFLLFAATQWSPHVRRHEALYLLGSRRVVDPGFLAGDMSWSAVPPTSFLFDHALAPLWGLTGDFGIVVLGRLLTWALLAWSLARLFRILRLPPWSAVAGAFLWLLWDQTLVTCGALLEGFQPKSFAYPLAFFSLAFAVEGRVVRAGLAAGLATAFHIIVGGWCCLALFLTVLGQRRLFSLRQVGTFLAATLPFTVPLVLAVGLFHAGGVSSDERAAMDAIYVTFAQPHCTDPTSFMQADRWVRVAAVLPLAVLLLLLWPRERRAGTVVAGFVATLALFHGLGMLASPLEQYWYLKVYPFKPANGIVPLLFFVLVLGFAGGRPERRWDRAVWVVAIVVLVWLVDDRDVLKKDLPDLPGDVAERFQREPPSRYHQLLPESKRMLYAWIRKETPRDSLFVTPYVADFWTYAERPQLASMRHPPHDVGLIEWRRRLGELNRSRPFEERGFEITKELNRNAGRLSARELAGMRDRYGATHYLALAERDDLADHELFAAGRFHVYGLAGLPAGE